MNAPISNRTTNSGWAAWSTTAAIAIWAVAIVAGWALIQRYEFATNSTRAQQFVDRWPAATELQRPTRRPTVVLFMHPKCPCTRASLQELNRLYASLGDEKLNTFDTIFVSTVPAEPDDTWLDTDTLATARQFPGGQIFVDRDGCEAARFGATASGTVMIFDATGNRQYAGGVTSARAHEGDNAGRDTAAQILRGESTNIRELPTFGCALCLPTSGPKISATQLSTTVVPLTIGITRRPADATKSRP